MIVSGNHLKCRRAPESYTAYSKDKSARKGPEDSQLKRKREKEEKIKRKKQKKCIKKRNVYKRKWGRKQNNIYNETK